MGNENYIDLKKRALEKYFENMNPEQRKAIFKIKGPVLILAGAGSGKTTVLVNRIANMIYFGNAYNSDEALFTDNEAEFLKRYADGFENDNETLKRIIAVDTVNPWNILAITFTNKAAGELKERISNMLGEAGEGLTAATFHSACVRILRRECDRIGFTNSFTIYDSDDSQRVLKSCLQELDISDKMFPPRMVLSEISRQKDMMISPQEYENQNQTDYRKSTIAKVYKLYQHKLLTSNAMDFDDIICHTVRLFEENPDVLSHYQNLYKYIVVDEYQDTNMVQYRLVSMLSSKFENLCVVGDDDQSIYKFRGATIENILSFENQFDECTVIRLEQNYRSTQNILSCANELIKNNKGRKGKNLWTAMGDGDKVNVYKAGNERNEARFIADTVLAGIKEGRKYNEYAVLYRMNAQSNAVEQAFVQSGISYKIIGGQKFFDRKEIKDILSYLAVINNHNDILRLRRIINEPKRSIGNATVTTLEQITSDLGIPIIDVMKDSEALVPLSKKAKVLVPLAQMFEYLTEISETVSLEELLDELMEVSGYRVFLKSQGEEGEMRLDNIEELKSTMVKYSEEAEEPSLSGFLEEISLFTDVDNLEEDGDYVVMMTIHSSKGLEFPTVFVAGMEENIFPSQRSIMESEAEVEEERRLAYVAITRAKKELYLLHSSERMLYGITNRNARSRFIKELPPELLNEESESLIRSTGVNTAYAKAQPVSSMSLQKQLAVKRRAETKTASDQNFETGNRVSHNIFGEGTVLSAKRMANDTMLEVAFDTKGTKKIMANFAKIKKL